MAAHELTADEENQVALARRMQAERDLHRVFIQVFGGPGERTPHGKLILEQLERFAGTRKLINETDTTGQTDVFRTGRKLGRCDVVQAIHDIIEWKEPTHADRQ